MADPVLTVPLAVTAPEPAGLADFVNGPGPANPGYGTVNAPDPETQRLNPPADAVEKETNGANVGVDGVLRDRSGKRVRTRPAAHDIFIRNPSSYKPGKQNKKTLVSKATETAEEEANEKARVKKRQQDLAAWKAPPLQWLEGRWQVTASTLPMWRKCKNVSITYKIIKKGEDESKWLLDDTVDNVPVEKTFMPQPKVIKGVDTPDGEGMWNWRGKGMLMLTTAHWEILGWGERSGERWVVTWFAPTMVSHAGLDIYCDRKAGMSKELEEDVIRVIVETLDAVEWATLTDMNMLPVRIDYDS